LVCEDERGERSVLTYAQLQHEVRRTAAALRGLGIGKGDRLGIYMPTCGEAIVLMLACVRIGAVHIALLMLLVIGLIFAIFVFGIVLFGMNR